MPLKNLAERVERDIVIQLLTQVIPMDIARKIKTIMLPITHIRIK